jgi:hypothetical protein
MRLVVVIVVIHGGKQYRVATAWDVATLCSSGYDSY